LRLPHGGGDRSRALRSEGTAWRLPAAGRGDDAAGPRGPGPLRRRGRPTRPGAGQAGRRGPPRRGAPLRGTRRHPRRTVVGIMTPRPPSEPPGKTGRLAFSGTLSAAPLYYTFPDANRLAPSLTRPTAGAIASWANDRRLCRGPTSWSSA